MASGGMGPLDSHIFTSLCSLSKQVTSCEHLILLNLLTFCILQRTSSKNLSSESVVDDQTPNMLCLSCENHKKIWEKTTMNHLVVANYFEESGNVSKTTDLMKIKEFPWFPNGNQPPSSVNVKLVVWAQWFGLFG